MSYYRLYPSKNNTLFRYLSYTNNILHGYTGENINAGANPIQELMDGKGESKLIYGFEFSSSLQQKLSSYSYTVNLQLWDAGTLWEPSMKLKNLVLETFSDDFSEGDGYSFLAPEHKTQVSNWIYRDSINTWSSTAFTLVGNKHMNRVNEDLNFDVTNAIQSMNGTNYIGFSLKVDNRENDLQNLYRKFIHSNYTKTVFKPYLEFFIDDTLKDKSLNCTATESNKVYIINKKGIDFPTTLTADILINNTTTTVNAIKEKTGIYYITVNPTNIPSIIKKEFCSITWKVGGTIIEKQLLEIKAPFFLQDEYDSSKLYFYPAMPSTHNLVKQGDIIPISVISEIRTQGTILIDTFEYRITSADGFEMCPWQSVAVYKNKMFFNINTEYFFPEQQYEIFIRNKTASFTLTSPLTLKFKVQMNDKSHLRELTTSPYYSREQFFFK